MRKGEEEVIVLGFVGLFLLEALLSCLLGGVIVSELAELLLLLSYII